jgi:hypothetical protein
MHMSILLWVVSLSMLGAAAAFGVVTWRTIRGTRERESARVELLRTMAFPAAEPMPASGPSFAAGLHGLDEFQPERETAPAAAMRVHQAPADEAAPIFAEHPDPSTARPRRMMLAGVGAAMFVALGAYALSARGPMLGPTSTTAAAGTPIELIGLQHAFGPGKAFDVSGVVRNPANGRTLPDVQVVVNLVGADGRILTTGTALLEQSRLEAGQTSRFSLAFPQVNEPVARFQVEFRGNGRDRILHVDRRAAQSAANAPRS